VQQLLHRQGGDAGLCFMSEKFRKRGFYIISLYSADQNNDDDDNDDDDEFKHA
jgi:hypothetical protein